MKNEFYSFSRFFFSFKNLKYVEFMEIMKYENWFWGEEKKKFFFLFPL